MSHRNSGSLEKLAGDCAIIPVIRYRGVPYSCLVRTWPASGVGTANTTALALLPLLSALLPVCLLAPASFLIQSLGE